MNLQDSIDTIKFVGESNKLLFNKIGIKTVLDLFNYLPYKYVDSRKIYSIKSAMNDFSYLYNLLGNNVKKIYLIKGRLVKLNSFRTRKRSFSIIKAEFRDIDEDQKLMVTWFNQNYLLDILKEGQDFLLFGNLKLESGAIIMNSPQLYTFNEFYKKVHINRIIPYYSQKGKLTSKYIRRIIFNAKPYFDHIHEYIPSYALKKYRLIDIKTAYFNIHFPNDVEDIKRSYHRLVIQDFLEYIKLNLRDKKEAEYPKLLSINGKQALDDLSNLIGNLHFKLTESQHNVTTNLLKEFINAKNDEYLLYGDVGSGKTIIFSLISMILALQGISTLIMVPTIVLRNQHILRLTKLLEDLNLGDGVSVKQIRKNNKSIKITPATIYVGTQEFLYKQYDGTSNVGLIVIDEQHKFGINQRESLKNQFKMSRILTVTATPIPRSLAQSVLGFKSYFKLESRIGRDNVSTRVVTYSKLKDLFIWLKKKVDNGSKAFIVFPRLDSAENLTLNLMDYYKHLSTTIFKGCDIGVLHGRLPNKKKQEVIDKLLNGDINILFTTQVIEVGVDIQDLDIIVIVGADRFGLAQLHQLRGRVGRDGRKSYCFLVPSSEEISANGLKRLELFSKTLDAFKLSDIDLKLRGPGNILGDDIQSGKYSLKIADLSDLGTFNQAWDIFKDIKGKVSFFFN